MRITKTRIAVCCTAAVVGLLLVQELISNGAARYHDSARDVYNSTLGFEKVFAILTPGRHDKADAISLAAAIAGFEFEISPGVIPDDIPAKAMPPTWNAEDHMPTQFGCWRAHMNVLRSILSRRISTALIVEDDSDWSFYFKDQLFDVARGMQAIEHHRPDENSPYGNDWDMLWIGTCRIGPHENATEFWVTNEGPTNPPVPKRFAEWHHIRAPEEVFQNDTRLLFKSGPALCTYGYAVSFRGAQKIVSALSLSGTNIEIDEGYRDLCMGVNPNMPNFKCLGTYPPLISSHRAAGDGTKDSDINDWESGLWHQEFTQDIPFSSILSRHRLLEGHKTLLSQQSYGRYATPDLPPVELSIDQPHYISRGSIKHIDMESVPTLIDWKILETSKGVPAWMSGKWRE